MKRIRFGLVVFSVLASILAVNSSATANVRINDYSSVMPGVYDSLGNGYFAEGNGVTKIIKIATDGTKTTFVSYEIPGGGTHWVTDIKIAPDGSFYTYGRMYFSTGSQELPYIAKFSSSGAFAWQTYWQGSFTYYAGGIDVLSDSSVVAQFKTVAGHVALKRVSASGSDLWTREVYSNTGSFGELGAIATDNLDNTYLAFKGGTAQSGKVVIASLDSTGAIRWLVDTVKSSAEELKFDSTSGNLLLLAVTNSCGFIVSISQTGQISEDQQVSCYGGSWTLAVDSAGSWFVASDSSSSVVKIRKYTSAELVYELSIDTVTGNRRSSVSNLSISSTGDILFTNYQGCGVPVSDTSCGYFRLGYAPPQPPSISSFSATYGRSTSYTISGAIRPGEIATNLWIDLSQNSNMTSAETYLVLDSVNGASQIFTKTINPIQLGATYFYQVRATNSLGTATSTIQSFSVPGVPSTPTLGIARIADTTNALLTWNRIPDNGAPLEGYAIERKIGSSGTWQTALAAPVVSGFSQSATHINLVANSGDIVYYRLQMSNAAGWSNFSEQVSIQLPSAPSAPVNVNASQLVGDIIIGWDRPTNWASADSLIYTLEATLNGLTWTPIIVASRPTSTSAVFDSGTIGNFYRFRITATNFLGTSPVSTTSNIVQMTSQVPPPAQTPPAQAPGNTTVIINTPEVVINTPAVNVYAPTASVGATLTAASIATGLGITIPQKAKTTVAISKSSKKFCKVKSGKVVGIKPGPCLATVTMQAPKPKKGKKPAPVKKSVTVQIS